MFGIGGGELIFILLIVLMLFGSDKIPEIARTLGKGLRQLKDATNDIKSEITNSADAQGLNKSLFDIRANINNEIEKAKENLLSDPAPQPTPETDLPNSEPTKIQPNIDDIPEGPIKRQM